MRTRMASRIIISILMMFGVYSIDTGKIQAASFDCSKAETAREKLICSDNDLSYTEELLDKVYKDALGEYPDKEELRNNQNKWLDSMNYLVEGQGVTCDADCLLTEYKTRIDLISTRYLTFVYAIDNYTGEYSKYINDDRKSGTISVQPMSGNTIKFKVTLKYRPEEAADAYTCNIGEHGGVIAKFIDKRHAVIVSDDKYCVIVLSFDKNRLKVSHSMNCEDYCGQDSDYYGKQYWGVRLEGIYIKKN